MSQQDFIKKVKAIYGDFFDYSKVEYRGMKEKIIISSAKFGEEEVIPSNLFCYNLADRKRRKGVIKSSQIQQSYRVWKGIIARCNQNNDRYRAYRNCRICKEWENYKNFKIWFEENYIPGYQIDKDIIKKGNKIYCPEYCCFVPREINLLIKTRGIRATEYPPGVHKTKSGKYEAHISIKKKITQLGTFDSAEVAFAKYKEKKEAHIRHIAQEYYDAKMIGHRIYDALMNYKIENTD